MDYAKQKPWNQGDLFNVSVPHSSFLGKIEIAIVNFPIEQ
jgi:hypothetical protein